MITRHDPWELSWNNGCSAEGGAGGGGHYLSDRYYHTHPSYTSTVLYPDHTQLAWRTSEDTTRRRDDRQDTVPYSQR